MSSSDQSCWKTFVQLSCYLANFMRDFEMVVTAATVAFGRSAVIVVVVAAAGTFFLFRLNVCK